MTKAAAKTSYYYSVQAVSKKWGVKSGYTRNTFVKTPEAVKATWKDNADSNTGQEKKQI